MPALCGVWHSEHEHGEQYGFVDYDRSLETRVYRCRSGAEAVIANEPWTFVTFPVPYRLFDHRTICGHQHSAHKDAIVIAVDGACRGNGGPDAVCGIGVFVGVDSIYNRAERVKDAIRNTSQRAELLAALEALEVVKRLWMENPSSGVVRRGYLPPAGPWRKLRRAVIKADSKYLVDAMTDYIFKWRDNGFLNARGQNVINADLFKQLEERVYVLDCAGVTTQFWHVSREENGEADWLASMGIDGYPADEAMEYYLYGV